MSRQCYLFHIIHLMFATPCLPPPAHPCQPFYYCASDHFCYHQGIFPIDFSKIFGLACMALAGGLSSAGGLGGGGLMMPFLTLYLNYLPKESTVIIFIAILGAQTGNLFLQFRKNRQVIRTRLCFLVGSGMAGATLVGTLINIIFPALFIVVLIVVTSAFQIRKVYSKAMELYQKENEQKSLAGEEQKTTQLMLKNRFIEQKNNFEVKFFWGSLAIFGLAYTLLNLKGSQTYRSWIGLEYCSVQYWLIYIFTAVFLLFLSYYLGSNDSRYSQQWYTITEYSSLSGIYAGFGLGGGLFLIRMCQELKMETLESTSTVSLCIFMTAMLNAIQTLMVGAITLNQFLQLYLIIAIGSFLVSRLISGYIERNNRYSYLQFLLVLLVLISMVSIPYSALMKWSNSGYDNAVLIGFKAPC